jgi:hypothetical protein
MYNLTVDQVHTFFVGDGQWLVHNADGPCSSLFLKYASFRRNAAEQIANGHSKLDHADSFIGAITNAERADQVQSVIDQAIKKGNVIQWPDGRISFWDGGTGFVHVDPTSADFGTFFRNEGSSKISSSASAYWNGLMNDPRLR